MCSLGKRVVVTAPNEFLCPVWGVEDALIPHIQSYYSAYCFVTESLMMQ